MPPNEPATPRSTVPKPLSPKPASLPEATPPFIGLPRPVIALSGEEPGKSAKFVAALLRPGSPLVFDAVGLPVEPAADGEGWQVTADIDATEALLALAKATARLVDVLAAAPPNPEIDAASTLEELAVALGDQVSHRWPRIWWR